MPPPPRYHTPSRWEQERGEDIRTAARTLARLLGTEDGHGEWRAQTWQRPHPRGWSRRGPPGWPRAPPPRRAFRGAPEQRRWRPFPQDRRWGTSSEWSPPRARPWDWRSRVLPRRGPPVAAIRVPRRYRQEELCTRQPQGVKPRGTLRGGPERSAEEPWMPSKTTQDKTEGKGAGKPRTEAARRPTIITVDGDGREKTWGPLSRSSARRAGSFWEEMDRTVKVFLEKDGKRDEVHVRRGFKEGRWFSGWKKGLPNPLSNPEKGRRTDNRDGRGGDRG